jgi:uncharacterized membrane protein
LSARPLPTAGHLGLRLGAVLCHATLVAAVAVLLYTRGGATPWRAVGALIGVAPLLLTWPGLYRAQRRVEQWLCVLLVNYSGAASVEVVATGGAEWAASVALLTSIVELGLLLALIRRLPSRRPAGRE